MRILYFSRDYTTHDRRFLEKLAASRHEVWYLRLEDDGIPYEDRPLPEGIHPIRMDSTHKGFTPYDCLRLMPEFEAVLNHVRPDLVHAGPVQTCGWMTALSGFRPFVLMSWGSDMLVDSQKDETWAWVTRHTLTKAERLLCDCKAVRLKAEQFFALPDNYVVEFPWGVDLKQFSPGSSEQDLRRRLQWEDAVVVLSTRTWERIYGIEVLLEAFRRAHARNPRLRLMLLGDGSFAPWVRHYLAEHALESVVHLPGILPENALPQVFHAADVYISCSYSDGTSISLLQAMATGLPVIATDIPGNREWLENGENGWLSEAGSPEAYAEAMLEAAALDTSARMRVAGNNRKLVEMRADWEKNITKLLKAYDEIEARYAR